MCYVEKCCINIPNDIFEFWAIALERKWAHTEKEEKYLTPVPGIRTRACRNISPLHALTTELQDQMVTGRGLLSWKLAKKEHVNEELISKVWPLSINKHAQWFKCDKTKCCIYISQIAPSTTNQFAKHTRPDFPTPSWPSIAILTFLKLSERLPPLLSFLLFPFSMSDLGADSVNRHGYREDKTTSCSDSNGPAIGSRMGEILLAQFFLRGGGWGILLLPWFFPWVSGGGNFFVCAIFSSEGGGGREIFACAIFSRSIRRNLVCRNCFWHQLQFSFSHLPETGILFQVYLPSCTSFFFLLITNNNDNNLVTLRNIT